MYNVVVVFFLIVYLYIVAKKEIIYVNVTGITGI